MLHRHPRLTLALEMACTLAGLRPLLEAAAAATDRRPTTVVIDADNLLEIKGHKVFHIGCDLPPPPDGKAYIGKNAITEPAHAGVTFLQPGPGGAEPWRADATFVRQQNWFGPLEVHAYRF